MGKWFSLWNNEEFAKQIEKLKAEQEETRFYVKDLYEVWEWVNESTKYAKKMDAEYAAWCLLRISLNAWADYADNMDYTKISAFLKSITKQIAQFEKAVASENEKAGQEVAKAKKALHELWN